jgi:hypothetical protein
MSFTKCGLNGPVPVTPGTAPYHHRPATSIASPFAPIVAARRMAIARLMPPGRAGRVVCDTAAGPKVTGLTQSCHARVTPFGLTLEKWGGGQA